jgi:AcrR family transcriptional regulator
VAERAGVSIGTLYQYFADKNALIRAIATRELQAALGRVGQALRGEIDPSPEGRVRAMIRAIITAFRGRQRARKAVLQAILSQGGGNELLAPVATFLAEHEAELGREPQHRFATLERHQLFVVSRALMGAIRAAVLEEQPFLRDPAFEDELVRLVMSYLRAVRAT